MLITAKIPKSCISGQLDKYYSGIVCLEWLPENSKLLLSRKNMGAQMKFAKWRGPAISHNESQRQPLSINSSNQLSSTVVEG